MVTPADTPQEEYIGLLPIETVCILSGKMLISALQIITDSAEIRILDEKKYLYFRFNIFIQGKICK